MKSEKSNHIDMDKSELKKLSKSELIKLLLKQEKKQKKPEIIVVDDTKPSPKPSERPKKKQKVVYNHDNLFDDNPFPDFTNDPFERTMVKVNNKKRDIDEQSINIDSKYQNLMSKPVQVAMDAASTQKIRYYPKIEKTLDKFRKDEMKMSTDKRRRYLSFIDLSETRLNKIPGNRETVSISLDVNINVPCFRKPEEGEDSNVDEFEIPYKKVIESNNNILLS